MIHYHGGPITPLSVAEDVWTKRHAFISYESPEQIAFAAEICQSFALDNGAFSVWRRGAVMDLQGYVAWVKEWERHPGFDWALIPDSIEGDEAENDRLIEEYAGAGGRLGVPVWHLHESFDRLARLCEVYPRVALGSSGQWAEVGTHDWWQRMGAAMDAVCNDLGQPPTKLHGLRMLNPTVFSHLPLSSADSTNVARNHNRRTHQLTQHMEALALVSRIEGHASAPFWSRTFGTQMNLDLVG